MKREGTHHRMRVGEHWTDAQVSRYAMRMFLHHIDRRIEAEGIAGADVFRATDKSGGCTLAFGFSRHEALALSGATLHLIGRPMEVVIAYVTPTQVIDSLRDMTETYVSHLGQLHE